MPDDAMAECIKHGTYVGHCSECEDLADSRDILNRTIIPPLSGEGSVGDVVSVPREPTEEMLRAMDAANINPPHQSDGSISVRVQNEHIWNAALRAAPPLPAQEVTDATEPLGSPINPKFKPTRNDLDALRKDYADMEGREGFPVTVHVAPAVLYMAWPNSQYQPDDGSSPYHCISFHIPKPPESTLRTGEDR